MKKAEYREAALSVFPVEAQFRVISTPDYSGGNRVVLQVIGSGEEFPPLKDFEYIEWEGDLSKAISQRNTQFWESSEVFHEPRKEWFISLRELVEMCF